MKSRNSRAFCLISAALAGGSFAGCGATATTSTETATPTALTISGTLNSSSALTLQSHASSQLDQSGSFLSALPVSSLAVTYSDFLVSCVTFTVPPVAGTGGTPNASGVFTVSFGDGSIGKSFGCFITKPADSAFDAIPMVFKDTTKTGMDGNAKQDTRLAVTGNISIPAVTLDLTAGTATVDTTTIVSVDTGTSTNVVAAPTTGTNFDFTGNWVVQDLASNGLTAPSGYQVPISADARFEMDWANRVANNGGGGGGGGGPMLGMALYLQRLAGKSFTPDSTCAAAVAANKAGTGSPILSCGGTTGTEDRYGIQIWATGDSGDYACVVGNWAAPTDSEKSTCKANYLASVAAATPPATVYATNCGRKLGFTAVEAKAMGQVDFTGDANYSASGSTSGPSDTKYYDGPFAFATTATLTDSSLYGPAVPTGMSPPFSQAAIDITDGWKITQAQAQWSQQNNCQPVDVLVGTVAGKAWRCYGNYNPNCTETDWNLNCTDTTGQVAAFQENAGMGCTDSLGAAVNFSNWNEFWCNGAGGCTNTCTTPTAVQWVTNGVASAAGYEVTSCGQKSTGFTPKDQSGNTITATGDISCKNGGGMWDNTVPSAPVLKMGGSTFDWDGMKFRPTRATSGTLCSAMDTSSGDPADYNRQLLAQLQCYANAYHKAQNSITGCTREIKFNYGTKDPWNFVASNNGPAKAKGEVIFELFNYTANDAGTFSVVETREEGIQSRDAMGGNSWIPCTVNSSETISLTVISSTKLLVEMTENVALANKTNPTCVAAAADGTLRTGLSKGMFVMSKQ